MQSTVHLLVCFENISYWFLTEILSLPSRKESDSSLINHLLSWLWQKCVILQFLRIKQIAQSCNGHLWQSDFGDFGSLFGFRHLIYYFKQFAWFLQTAIYENPIVETLAAFLGSDTWSAILLCFLPWMLPSLALRNALIFVAWTE